MEKDYNYSDDSMSFHYTRDEGENIKSRKFPVHTHLFNELYYFIGGKASFKIEGTVYPLRSGDILIMRGAESHSLQIEGDEPYERLAIHFDPEIIKKIDPQLSLLKPYYDRELGKRNLYRESDFKTRICSMLMDELTEESENPRRQIVSTLIPVLNELLKVFESHKENDTGKINEVGKSIIDYINSNLFDDISLDGICKKFFISKPQLCRIFKASTGSTVWEYITVKRLMEARKMIISGVPSTKAAQMCGFNDYSVFFRAYKRKFNISPKKTI